MLAPVLQAGVRTFERRGVLVGCWCCCWCCQLCARCRDRVSVLVPVLGAGTGAGALTGCTFETAVLVGCWRCCGLCPCNFCLFLRIESPSLNIPDQCGNGHCVEVVDESSSLQAAKSQTSPKILGSLESTLRIHQNVPPRKCAHFTFILLAFWELLRGVPSGFMARQCPGAQAKVGGSRQSHSQFLYKIMRLTPDSRAPANLG